MKRGRYQQPAPPTPRAPRTEGALEWVFPENFQDGEHSGEVWASVVVPELSREPIRVSARVTNEAYCDLAEADDPEAIWRFAEEHPAGTLLHASQLGVLDALRAHGDFVRRNHLPRRTELESISLSRPEPRTHVVALVLRGQTADGEEVLVELRSSELIRIPSLPPG